MRLWLRRSHTPLTLTLCERLRATVSDGERLRAPARDSEPERHESPLEFMIYLNKFSLHRQNANDIPHFARVVYGCL